MSSLTAKHVSNHGMTTTIKAIPGWNGLVLVASILSILLSACITDDEGDHLQTGYKPDPSWPPAGMKFDEVSWIDISHQDGTVYVLQRSQPAVTIWSSNGQLLDSWHTTALGDPHSISVQENTEDGDIVWITDMAPPQPAGNAFGHCLKRFTATGKYTGSIGTCSVTSMGSGLDPVQFDKVTDIAFNAAGHLIVTDGDLNGMNNRVLTLTPQGEVLAVWSAPGNKPGSGLGEFNLPHDVLVDDCQRVWIADALNHRVQVLGLDGAYYGEYQCFGTDGVYGIDMTGTVNGTADLFVASSPSSGGGVGVVSVFSVPMTCNEPTSIGTCLPTDRWGIRLPHTSETALLHSIAISADGSSLYLAELGGELPPQKWVKHTSVNNEGRR